MIGVEVFEGQKWGWPYQRHSGTRIHRCGCSLPGLTRFTVYHCGGTSRATITIRDYPDAARMLTGSTACFNGFLNRSHTPCPETPCLNNRVRRLFPESDRTGTNRRCCNGSAALAILRGAPLHSERKPCARLQAKQSRKSRSRFPD